MNKPKRMIIGAVLSAGVALAAVGLAEGTAQALPGGPVPLSAWPGCPEDNPSGPCHWCPGDPPVQTGNLARVPGGLGQQRLPHLLVCLQRAGQRGAQHLRGRGAAGPAAASAEPDSAASTGVVLVAVHSDDELPERLTDSGCIIARARGRPALRRR